MDGDRTRITLVVILLRSVSRHFNCGMGWGGRLFKQKGMANPSFSQVDGGRSTLSLGKLKTNIASGCWECSSHNKTINVLHDV